MDLGEEVVISVYRDGQRLISRHVDSQNDFYQIPVPFSFAPAMSGFAGPGDTLYVRINGLPVQQPSHVLVEQPGADIELDLALDAVQLTVENDHFSGNPSGADWYGRGETVWIDAAPVVMGEVGVRYHRAGFTGSGSVPDAGADSPVQVTLSEDSSIFWQWETAHRLETLVEPPYAGTITVYPSADEEGFFEPGQSVQITADPHPGFLFREWAVDAQGSDESTHLLMQGPRGVVAIFDRDANEDGLPDEWQVIHFGSYLADRAAPDADSAGSNMTNLEKWIAGIDPNDPESVFRISKLQTTAPEELKKAIGSHLHIPYLS